MKGIIGGDPNDGPHTESQSDMRMKYWKELNADEKTERLRDIVKGQQSEIQSLREQFNQLEGKFSEHSHHKYTGRVVVPVSGFFGGITSAGIGRAPSNMEAEANGEVYF